MGIIGFIVILFMINFLRKYYPYWRRGDFCVGLHHSIVICEWNVRDIKKRKGSFVAHTWHYEIDAECRYQFPTIFWPDLELELRPADWEAGCWLILQQLYYCAYHDWLLTLLSLMSSKGLLRLIRTPQYPDQVVCKNSHTMLFRL